MYSFWENLNSRVAFAQVLVYALTTSPTNIQRRDRGFFKLYVWPQAALKRIFPLKTRVLFSITILSLYIVHSKGEILKMFEVSVGIDKIPTLTKLSYIEP